MSLIISSPLGSTGYVSALRHAHIRSNALAWDPSNGTVLRTYKGAVAAHGGICVADKCSKLVISSPDSPFISIWRLEGGPSLRRFPLLEKMACVLCTPDSQWLIGGTASDKLFIWQVASGKLWNVVSGAHYRGVSALACTSDGGMIVTGGMDASVKLWSLPRIVSKDTGRSITANHTWSDHTLAITQVHCGLTRPAWRLFSASRDHTVKIYDGIAHTLLVSLVFPAAIECLVVDTAERVVHVGAADGVVYRAWLTGSVAVITNATDAERMHPEVDKDTCLRGHTDAVISIATSDDSSVVVSGSLDCSVRVWDTASGQLLRIFSAHKAPVSNVVFVNDHEEASTFGWLQKYQQEADDVMPITLNGVAETDRLEALAADVGHSNDVEVVPSVPITSSVDVDKLMRENKALKQSMSALMAKKV